MSTHPLPRPSATPPSTAAAVVLPVKPPAAGKSRLRQDDDRRTALAAAFALDTAAAAAGTPGVVGVLALCDDHVFARRLREAGCVVVPDAVPGDLNATLQQGAHEAVRRWPGSIPVALCADLPALTVGDLGDAVAQALEQVAEGPVFVEDADGTGTSLYAARLEEFDPRFGTGSAQAHVAAGALALRGPLPTLRRDVDDPVSLGAAAALGVGAHTAALLG